MSVLRGSRMDKHLSERKRAICQATASPAPISVTIYNHILKNYGTEALYQTHEQRNKVAGRQ